MEKRKHYRRFLLIILLLVVAGGGWCVYAKLRDSIPDKVYYCEDDERPFENLSRNPLVTYSEDIKVSGNKGCQITCSLCHLIPLKTVYAEKTERESVYACALPVGIYMETDGVLVVAAGEVENLSGELVSPAGNLVQPGDYIEEIDGEKLLDKKQLIEQVQAGDGADVSLTLVRDGHRITRRLTPVLGRDGIVRIGVWVRDNIQGIGTLTYLYPDGSFGALGHGISDTDTGELLKLGEGELYRAEIMDVVRGAVGSPGELQGVIHYQTDEELGTIRKNTPVGIYGQLDAQITEAIQKKPCEIAMKQEVQEGDASILVCEDGQLQEYQARISQIDMGMCHTNKCFQIEVTDPTLLSRTGGIVQGMSGSPILQDGRLIGAVTHVFVNDPTRGYGIFAETMLEQQG